MFDAHIETKNGCIDFTGCALSFITCFLYEFSAFIVSCDINYVAVGTGYKGEDHEFI